MGIGAVIVLAFAMSMDAFAASIAKGAVLEKTDTAHIIKTALVFGAVETVTPLIGWACGRVAQQFISDWDHWIAFVLLSVLGCKMICGAMGGREADGETPRPSKNGFLLLLATAVATSIDSMVVGVGLAFLNVNIAVTALMIGAATTLMSAAGIVLGRFFGQALGRRAEILGGTVLLIIGLSILTDHLS